MAFLSNRAFINNINNMKSIQLKDKHKEQILEMIRKLFPEFVKVDFCTDNSDYDQFEYENCLELFTQLDKDGQEWAVYHWFEFCMSNLMGSLGISLAKTDIVMDAEWEEFIDNTLTAIFKNNEHPVEYLYEQFKKLK